MHFKTNAVHKDQLDSTKATCYSKALTGNQNHTPPMQPLTLESDVVDYSATAQHVVKKKN